MTKRAFIIHGWEGYPEEGWFPWLKKELENKGYQVQVPAMPNSENPKIDEWVPFLSELVQDPDKETFFVGHSIGCQTILRYLESLEKDTKIGGVVFVAGWINLMNLSDPEEEMIAKPWLETPIEWDNIVKHTNKFVAIFSDNDQFVPIGDSEIFKKRLGAAVFIEHEKGHFKGEDNITNIPLVLEELLKMTK
jgi:predicted alpha/beta hydrolase family esterase